MNILYISSEYPPETGYGGIGTYTKYIAEGMASRGHTVSVIARSNNSVEKTEQRHGVTICRIAPLPYPLPTHRYAYPLRRFCTSGAPHTLNRLSWAMAVSRKINSHLQESISFDIIESPECGAEGCCISAQMAKRRIIRLHTPWEMIRRHDGLQEPWGDHIMLPLLEKWTARRAHAVSAPSHAIATCMEKLWHLAAVTVIRNPLPVALFKQSKGETWIYTGRIERRKGVHHLINAYAKVRQSCRVPLLKLIGRAYGTDKNGKDYGDLIKAMIADLGIQQEVQWLENANLEDVAFQLQDAAVAFFPSLWENFPYACLEAMSSGCTVVATRCGGFPEIIAADESGLLVDPDSAEALEAAMVFLLKNPDRRYQLGCAARKRMKDMVSADQICREMELFYLQLLEC
jgi:glycogen(starch) synthase